MDIVSEIVDMYLSKLKEYWFFMEWVYNSNWAWEIKTTLPHISFNIDYHWETGKWIIIDLSELRYNSKIDESPMIWESIVVS